ncbi:MAG: deoxyribodipyrimidine photolyase [Acidobacteria bacterium]|nr:deoxyribodipyrimidine photolyase [Acidobacteriota bacterium]NIM61767.1 deoxyribodipyrimidine photolyase [Acidobacteriota bacterium]NIO60011.1 deoxyribodipyrimidine photolyase [Acidobacteriota bacterium]NIQ29203.1 deoxyribodipyrimidine photolyase [Acidobacteriota bacterium]NIQ83777.1 deoxyribodipyrimidine photolyase [Acidobacteriota bacterium]
MNSVPANRIRPLNSNPVRRDGGFVLYWMVASRRTRSNFALQRAVELARETCRPLVVLEALRCDYPWASDRFHAFVLDGMADNEERFRRVGIPYLAYVEPRVGAGKGLLAALAKDACAVVTDDYPAFMLPQVVAAGARQVRVRMEAVDSNGLMPMSLADRVFPTAYAFRRFLQKELRDELLVFPKSNPLARLDLPTLERLPEKLADRWPTATSSELRDPRALLQTLPVDHAVGSTANRGGSAAAGRRLRGFLDRLDRYAEDRNLLDEPITSGLSPYIHFGHVSAHEVCRAVLKREHWTPDRLSDTASGSRQGWWGVGASAEAFLDQLVTWRELGFNMCRLRSDHDRYASLPDWARQTLQDHAGDRRDHVYSLEQFESADTHDDVWNAAQRQLRRDGTIHNYLRMLWGKKILDWSESPQTALDIMIELNNRYALDGRDPNSYSGIFWTLGRYDRPWGPERPVFGKVRYMSSKNTRRKLNVTRYLERYGSDRCIG